MHFCLRLVCWDAREKTWSPRQTSKRSINTWTLEKHWDCLLKMSGRRKEAQKVAGKDALFKYDSESQRCWLKLACTLQSRWKIMKFWSYDSYVPDVAAWVVFGSLVRKSPTRTMSQRRPPWRRRKWRNGRRRRSVDGLAFPAFLSGGPSAAKAKMAEEEQSWRSVGFVTQCCDSFGWSHWKMKQKTFALTVSPKTLSCNMRNGHESLISIRTLHDEANMQ